MSKQIYDIMICADGSTRAVEVINGVVVDPTLEVVKKQAALDKKELEKKSRPKISIQDRLQGKVEDFISVIEGQVDDFVDSDYKLKYDVYNHNMCIFGHLAGKGFSREGGRGGYPPLGFKRF